MLSFETSSTEFMREFRIYTNQPLIRPTDIFILSITFALLSLQMLSYPFQLRILLILLSILIPLILIWKKFNSVVSESLLAINQLGIQLTKVYRSGRIQTRFIDKNRIRSILINEGFHLCQIIFYLAFVVENKDKLELAFENLFPRKDILLQIYRGTREVMSDKQIRILNKSHTKTNS